MFSASWYQWMSDVGFYWVAAGAVSSLALWWLARARSSGGAQGEVGAAAGAAAGAVSSAGPVDGRASEEQRKREALDKVEALLRGAGAPVLRGALLLSKEQAQVTRAELVTVLHGALWALRVEPWAGYLRGERGAQEWRSVEHEGKGEGRVERATPRPNALRAQEPYLDVLRLVAHGKATREAQVVSALVTVGGEPRLKGLRGSERALSLPQLRSYLKGDPPPVSPESREAAQALWRRLRQLSEELAQSHEGGRA